MSRYYKLITIFACFSMVFACSSSNYKRNITKKYSFDKNSNVGLILGSVTLSQNGQFPETNWTGHPYLNVYFDVRSHQTNEVIAKISNDRPVNIGASVLLSSLTMFFGVVGSIHDKSQFSGQHGQVFAFELPPGKYSIHRWEVVSSNAQANFATSSRFKHIPLEFESKLGEISYIGNINMNIKKISKNFFGYYVFEDLVAEVMDKNERDISLFKKTYPNIRSNNIKKRIIKVDKLGEIPGPLIERAFVTVPVSTDYSHRIKAELAKFSLELDVTK